MEIGPALYGFVARFWRNEAGRKMKDALRPVKFALVGKTGIYKVIERVGELDAAAGKEVRVVFDVGAAIGEAVTPMLGAFPNAEAYCFEPNPAQFSLLKERTQRLGARIHYFNIGLFNVNDTATFNVNSAHPDASSFINEPGDDRTITVTRRRLDDVVKEIGCAHIDLLKIDVEGVEKDLLEGARETLLKTDSVYIEISPLRKGLHVHDYIEVFEMLHQAGFSYEGFYGDYFFTKLLK